MLHYETDNNVCYRILWVVKILITTFHRVFLSVPECSLSVPRIPEFMSVVSATRLSTSLVTTNQSIIITVLCHSACTF